MDYEIVSRTPTMFIGNKGLPVSGWTVYVRYPEFNETHNFNTESIKAEVVDTQARAILSDLRSHEKLGKSTGHD